MVIDCGKNKYICIFVNTNKKSQKLNIIKLFSESGHFGSLSALPSQLLINIINVNVTDAASLSSINNHPLHCNTGVQLQVKPPGIEMAYTK